MARYSTNYARWKSRLPEPTRVVADLVEQRLIPQCELAGFLRVYVWNLDRADRIPANEIQMERRRDAETDMLDIGFAKYGVPRFQVGAARVTAELPHEFVRSCTLVANASQYYHYWGKPWWLPSWAWSTEQSERTIERVISGLPQLLAFLETGARGPNISKQVGVPPEGHN